MIRRIVASSLFLTAPLVMAESAEKRLTPLGAQSLLETVGGLLLVLLLIFAGAWLFRRYAQLPVTGKNLISVLGGVSVGPRERVLLLKVEETRLVVGVAPGQVRTLHVLGRPEQPGGSFSSQLASQSLEQEGG
ncbi:MAG: flagellar biosynthetic protein FliO [Gammaproteobacteria bacterium]|nr:flagellar biosynthetic protein FliO [Gammaproteobacteria bacterium]